LIIAAAIAAAALAVHLAAGGALRSLGEAIHGPR
jgi:hypothetical protein